MDPHSWGSLDTLGAVEYRSDLPPPRNPCLPNRDYCGDLGHLEVLIIYARPVWKLRENLPELSSYPSYQGYGLRVATTGYCLLVLKQRQLGLPKSPLLLCCGRFHHGNWRHVASAIFKCQCPTETPWIEIIRNISAKCLGGPVNLRKFSLALTMLPSLIISQLRCPLPQAIT